MTLAANRKTIGAGERLEDLYRSFDHVTSATDPVHIVRRFTLPADREVVGFCAAALAFGRVASVLQSIESLLAVMGPHPAQFVRNFDPARERSRLEPLTGIHTRLAICERHDFAAATRVRPSPVSRQSFHSRMTRAPMRS